MFRQSEDLAYTTTDRRHVSHSLPGLVPWLQHPTRNTIPRNVYNGGTPPSPRSLRTRRGTFGGGCRLDTDVSHYAVRHSEPVLHRPRDGHLSYPPFSDRDPKRFDQESRTLLGTLKDIFHWELPPQTSGIPARPSTKRCQLCDMSSAAHHVSEPRSVTGYSRQGDCHPV